MNYNDNFITFITIYYIMPFGDLRGGDKKLSSYVNKILTHLCPC